MTAETPHHDDATSPSDAQFAPERLRCPSCGYTVFGLTEPRCPECGQGFDWDTVRKLAEGADTEFFEHRWKQKPLRSLLATWYRAAFHPVRIWSSYSDCSRFDIAPLMIFLVLQAVLFRLGWPAVARLVDPAMNGFSAWLAQTPYTPWVFTYDMRVLPDFFHVLAVWWLVTFAVMLLLFDPRGVVGPRWKHVLRIYVHATAFASFSFAAWCVLEALVDTGHFFLPMHPAQPVLLIGQGVYTWLGRCVFGVALVVTWACLWAGYHRYLRMPHGWAIAAIALFAGGVVAELVRLFI